MQYFKDTATEEHWSFDDDVQVVETELGLEFYTSTGLKLDNPLTLVRVDELPEPVVTTPVPEEITPFQGLAALAHYGHLEIIESYFSDPETPLLYRLAYQRATSWRRQSPTVKYMQDLMKWSDEYIDDLFIFGAGVPDA
ncbi:hypothetical protein [Achromobacter phage Motura]|uniref:Uncharacterized protein n=1 Tax=Achromobacter phage Motura TaxID=2591403 RepID=A0A514CT45_9CAUD|nr:hypothetical protein H1O15_gp154 [Achromobacter phage Motura]QDH83634.1 hypothetical protein [Achromobacter phage Motura]